MNIGLQIPSFKYPSGTAAIRPKLKEIVTTAEQLRWDCVVYKPASLNAAETMACASLKICCR